ncbi:hypothetical protein PINS_up005236 [Pythium insidiosum]|nr:hypothetical protein PINS_up005236 [Pythium insidiosum]
MPSSTTAQADALEELEPIRRSIRSVCLRDQRTWELSWTAVLGDVSHNSRRGVVLPDVVQQTLELNGVRLTTKALASALAPFRTPSGAVNLRQWLRWIDLSRPEDHVDPELHAARLPQPFRRVHKVLETDILDAAWQRIVRCSARYKAELAAGAALSARSARSSVLTLLPAPGAELDVLELQNDYEAAKKRCCKRARLEIALHEEPSTTSELRAVLRQDRESLRRSIELQLQPLSPSSLDHKSVRATPSSTVVVPVLSVDAASSSSLSLRFERVTGVARELSTPLSLQQQQQSRVLRIALLVSVVSETSTQSLVRVVDVPLTLSLSPSDDLSSSSSSSSSSTTTTIASLDSSSDKSDAMIASLDLAHDGTTLALASTANEIRVFALPLVATVESPLDLLVTTPSASWTTTMTTATGDSHVFFLASPALTADADADNDPNASSSSCCIAVVAGDSLSNGGISRPVACVSLDVSTQFLSLGLRDGTLVVWDLVAERDHVRYLVALSSASSASAREQTQELCFFDLMDRSAPLLIRSVRPPPPPPSEEEAQTERVAFTSLSLETSALDVPVVFVGYSNGFCMLMDVRNGEAMGSVRARDVGGLMQSCWPTRDAVVVVVTAGSGSGSDSGSNVSSLRVFDWAALLETAFPALPHLAVQRKLAADNATLKRLFLASVDDSQSLLYPHSSSTQLLTPSPLTLSSLAFGARPTLLSMLHATAGDSRTGGSVAKISPSTLTSPSKAGATHGAAATNSLSSLGTTASAVPNVSVPTLPLLSAAGATERHDAAALPPLPTQFLASRVSTAGDRDQRVHRRRNELLKALTAAW